MINEPGHPTDHLMIPLKEETIMLKTISAALLAVSVLAAPAMAAGTIQKTPAPATKSIAVTKTSEVKPVAKTAEVKSTQLKASVRNANAKMGRHHHRHVRHHRHHKR